MPAKGSRRSSVAGRRPASRLERICGREAERGDLRTQLESCFAHSVCLMGIGNLDYGDDGFGVRLAEELLAQGMRDVVIANTNPERYLGQVADRGIDHLLFLDAVEFGGPPGSVVFMDTEQIVPRFPQISTHKISLGVLAQWAEANGRTKAWLLGVEPGSTKPAQSLTPAVRTTLEALTELLCNIAGGQTRSPAPARTESSPAEEVQV